MQKFYFNGTDLEGRITKFWRGKKKKSLKLNTNHPRRHIFKFQIPREIMYESLCMLKRENDVFTLKMGCKGRRQSTLFNDFNTRVRSKASKIVDKGAARVFHFPLLTLDSCTWDFYDVTNRLLTAWPVSTTTDTSDAVVDDPSNKTQFTTMLYNFDNFLLSTQLRILKKAPDFLIFSFIFF